MEKDLAKLASSDRTPMLSTSIDIVSNPGKKLAESSRDEIAQALVKIYYIIGLRPQHFPTKEMDDFLFSYIMHNYGHRSIREMLHAFNLAIHGELDIDDAKAYDQFSIEYLVRIMNAYRKYKNKLIMETVKEKPMAQLPPAEPTPEETENDLKQMKDKAEKNLYFIPLYLYNDLVQQGKIQPDENKYLQEACGLYKKELIYKAQNGNSGDQKFLMDFIDMFHQGEIHDPHRKSIRAIIKRLQILDYLKSL